MCVAAPYVDHSPPKLPATKFITVYTLQQLLSMFAPPMVALNADAPPGRKANISCGDGGSHNQPLLSPVPQQRVVVCFDHALMLPTLIAASSLSFSTCFLTKAPQSGSDKERDAAACVGLTLAAAVPWLRASVTFYHTFLATRLHNWIRREDACKGVVEYLLYNAKAVAKMVSVAILMASGWCRL